MKIDWFSNRYPDIKIIEEEVCENYEEAEADRASKSDNSKGADGDNDRHSSGLLSNKSELGCDSDFNCNDLADVSRKQYIILLAAILQSI